MRYLLIMLFSFCATITYSQIEDEISSTTDSTELFLINGRNMLLDELNVQNMYKAEEIYNALNKKMDKSVYTAFSYTEDIYLNLLLGNSDNVISLMENYSKEIINKPYPKVFYIDDVLYDLFYKRMDEVKKNIAFSELEGQDQNAVNLLLYILEKKVADEKYNELLGEFKKNYPESKYNDFVKYYLPGKKVKVSWAWSLGAGALFPTNRFAKNFTSAALFHLSMDVNIDKIYTSFWMNASSLKLKEPFVGYNSFGDSLDFKRNEGFSYIEGGGKVGYFLVRNKHFHIAPYANIGGTQLKSSRFSETEEYNDNDLEYQICNSFSYGFGLHAEVKITEFDANNSYYTPYYPELSYAYLSLKLDAGYTIINSFKNSSYVGDINYINLSLVVGFGEF